MPRAWEAGDAPWALRGQPQLWIPHKLRGQAQSSYHSGFPLLRSRKWVTWGDIATQPWMISQQVSGNLVAGRRAVKASRSGDITPAGHPPSRVGRCQAGWRAKPERAERDFSMASWEHTGVPVLQPLAGSRCLQPHPLQPPSAPSQPAGLVGFPWDHHGGEREFCMCQSSVCFVGLDLPLFI